VRPLSWHSPAGRIAPTFQKKRRREAGVFLHRSWHLAIAIPSRRLAALEGNGSALDVGVGFSGINHHRLPVAAHGI